MGVFAKDLSLTLSLAMLGTWYSALIFVPQEQTTKHRTPSSLAFPLSLNLTTGLFWLKGVAEAAGLAVGVIAVVGLLPWNVSNSSSLATISGRIFRQASSSSTTQRCVCPGGGIPWD
jgi:hypothetical protein